MRHVSHVKCIICSTPSKKIEAIRTRIVRKTSIIAQIYIRCFSRTFHQKTQLSPCVIGPKWGTLCVCVIK